MTSTLQIVARPPCELDRVCEAAPTLLADHEPGKALRLWMDRFIDYMTSKLGIAGAVRAAVASGAPHPRSSDRLHQAMELLFQATARAEITRPDLNVDDVGLILVGIALAAGDPEMAAQRTRMLDLVFDGLQTRT